MSRTYNISRFNQVNDRRPKPESLSWPLLAQLLTAHTERPEKDGPLWSPASYEAKATRSKANVIEICALSLDFDGGHAYEDFIDEWQSKGYAFAVHTTHTHTPEHPKWRVVFPLLNPVPAADWQRVYRKLALVIGHGLTDPACSDESRIYFLPSCAPGADRYSLAVERGHALNEAMWPDVAEEIPDHVETGSSGATSARPGDQFEQVTSWESILQPHGWQIARRSGDLIFWTRPGKAVSDGFSASTGPRRTGDRFYCWSTSPEVGVPSLKLLTKFALHAHLNHGGDFRAAASALRGEIASSPSATKFDRVLRHIHITNRQMPEITADAIEALRIDNDPPKLFVRAGELVRVEQDERGVARVAPIGPDGLRGLMARSASWIRVTEKDEVRDTSPPKDIAADILALRRWPFPPVNVVSRAPLLGTNGHMRLTPGYHADTHSYVTDGPFPEWEGTSAEALAFLMEEMLGDFPFASDADRANALALALLPFVRTAIDGPTPLHLVDAPAQGTGKSLLVRVCLWPALGASAAATTATRDEEEWRKKIGGLLLEGKPVIFLDNLSRKLDSDSIAAALTTTEWTDRALGSMLMISVPVRCVWAATSNNAELSRDVARRTVWIRLDAGVERPEDRTGFRHNNIEEWCKENRPKLVSACCRLIQDWLAAGKPRYDIRNIGSYETYCQVIGSILCHHGVTAFLGNLDNMRSSVMSDDEGGWREFYEAWRISFGATPVGIKDVIDLAIGVDALAGVLGDGGDRSQRVRLGQAIGRRIGTISGDLRIVRAGTDKRAARFCLEMVEKAPDQPVLVNVGNAHSPDSQVQTVNVDSDIHQVQIEGEQVNVVNVEHTLRAHDRAPAHALTHARTCEEEEKHSPHSPHSPVEPESGQKGPVNIHPAHSPHSPDEEDLWSTL